MSRFDLAACLDAIVEGNVARRSAAFEELVAHDVGVAREELFGLLARKPRKAVRSAVVRQLHALADEDVTVRMYESARIDLQPERLTDALREALYARAARDVKARPKAAAKVLARVGLVPMKPFVPHASAEARALLVHVLDDERLAALHVDAVRALRLQAPEEAPELLRERWRSSPRGLVRWARLGCPPEDDPARLLEEVATGAVSEEHDALLVAAADHASPEVAQRLLRALRRGFPKLVDALAKRLDHVELGARIAMLDDASLERAHARLAQSLAMDPRGARAVVERGGRVSAASLAKALAHLPPEDVFDIASPRADTRPWSDALAATPLRDRRWLDLAPSLVDRGRRVLVTIARDREGTMRSRAVEALARDAEQLTDRLEKRATLYALGETGHPDATLALVAALDDPHLGDAAPLVCTALGACGDTRAIPVLETRTSGRHGAFVRAAIDAIRERVSSVHAAVLDAAREDEDPMLADLARRAHDGDADAAVVLEDALRERGRL